MRRAALLLVLLGFAIPAFANQRAQGFCTVGGKAVVTQGLNSTNAVQASYPQCTVTVYLHGTTTLATIFSDNNTSPTPLTNPFTGNADGSWGFYAAIGHYDIVLSGGQKGGFPTPFTLSDVLLEDCTAQQCGGGGANLPSVTQIISGDGTGNGLGMPEKGTTVAGGSAKVAWNEDMGLGLFDCRDTKYDGGCLGPTPGLAFQDMANDIICYNTATGLRGNVIFPPGAFPVGTPAHPSLQFPTGNRYMGASGGITGTSTLFLATYNNVDAIDFFVNLTATCGGVTKTDTLGDGSYLNFGVHGCGEGGCVNVPGDSTTYGNGGPGQNGVLIQDSQGWTDGVGADHNGSSGVIVGGIDSHSGNVWGNSNMEYYYFGKNVGPTYNPGTDTLHCNICLFSLDGTFTGPNETYGFVDSVTNAYGHLGEVGWGGGRGQLDHVFVNEGSIGILRGGGSFAGHAQNIRIDQVSGPAIAAGGAGDYYDHVTISGSCTDANIAWASVGSVAISNPGSGQTNGTYTLTGVGGLATTGGVDGNGGQAATAAQIQVVVAGGIATSVTVLNHGKKYLQTGVAPTFTMTAGGTPATFTVTMTPPLALQTVFPVFGYCDAVEEIGGGADHFANIAVGFDGSFGAFDYSSGGRYMASGGFWENVGGFLDTEVGEQPGQAASIKPNYENVQVVTGATPNVEQGGNIQPANSGATNMTGVSRAWQGEIIRVYSGDANTTLISTNNGGAWQTCDGYNINLGTTPALHGGASTAYTFTAVSPAPFLQTLSEDCDSIDKNHWWINHAANASSLPPLEQQGTVDSMGDIRSHAIPALAAIVGQAGGIPDGTHGFGGMWTYAYRVWGVFGTQTSATLLFNQCMPATGFVNNPCFQNETMTLPEGWTRYRLARESTTDAVATAGTIADVSFTAPQHATTVTFIDTYIAPLNATIIGAGHYSANITGGPWECGTLPTVSAYPAVKGQRCESPATGFCYWSDADDHWQRTTCTYANF